LWRAWKSEWIANTQSQTDQKMVIATEVICTDMVACNSREGLQIFGGHEYAKDALIDKCDRDAKVSEIRDFVNSLRV